VFKKDTILAILFADESSCCGKIILDSFVFICFHFIEGGLPPNCCAVTLQQYMNNE
jgi:hypothetical protein